MSMLFKKWSCVVLQFVVDFLSNQLFWLAGSCCYFFLSDRDPSQAGSQKTACRFLISQNTHNWRIWNGSLSPENHHKSWRIRYFGRWNDHLSGSCVEPEIEAGSSTKRCFGSSSRRELSGWLPVEEDLDSSIFHVIDVFAESLWWQWIPPMKQICKVIRLDCNEVSHRVHKNALEGVHRLAL